MTTSRGVTIVERVPTPQEDDAEFSVPFCQINGMSPDSVPDSVTLQHGEWPADKRAWTHHNIIPQEEMGDLGAAVTRRVTELREQELDVAVIGSGPGLSTSTTVAIFTAAIKDVD